MIGSRFQEAAFDRAFRIIPKTIACALALAQTVALSGCLPTETQIIVPETDSSSKSAALSFSGFAGVLSADTIGGSKIKLTWDASTDPTVLTYNVYDVTLISQPRLIKTVPAPSTYATVTGLTAQNLYAFRVRASSTLGKEDENTRTVFGIPYAGATAAQVVSSTSANIVFSDGSNAEEIKIYCKKNSETEYTVYKTLTDVNVAQAALTGLVAGTSYTCKAALSIGGIIDNNNTSVSFTPIGQADRMVFSAQPGSAPAGTPLGTQPVVTILDTQGNVVSAGPDSNPLISLSVATTSPTQGTIRGVATVQAVKGVATFVGLNFQEAGIKGLTASKPDTSAQPLGAPALTVNSDAFTISNGAVSPLTSTIAISPAGPLVANGAASYTVTIGLQDQYGNAVVGVKPTFASSSTADTLSQPISNTNSAGTTTGAIFTTVGGTKTLSILSPSGLGSVQTSAVFIAGSATKVAFIQQPANTPAGPGAMGQIQVAIQDAQGNVVTTGASATANVALSIFTNPGGGLLLGTATVAAVNGIALFAGLGIDKTGTGYKLVANSAPLSVAYSNSFNVTAGVPSKISVTGPSTLLSGACGTTAYTIQLQDFAGNPANATANTQINFTGLGTGQLFASNACSGTPIASSVTFSSGSNTKTYYLKDNAGESLNFTASDPANVLAAGSKNIKINPAQIALSGPTTVVSGKCSLALMVKTNGNNGTPGNVWVNTPFRINGLSGTGGKLHAQPDCSDAPLDSQNLTAVADTSLTLLYFSDLKAESVSLSVLDPSGILSTVTAPIQISVTPSRIVLTGPANVVAGDCSDAYTLKLEDAAGNVVPAPANTPITIRGLTGTSGAFYTSNSCGGAPLGGTIVLPQASSALNIYLIDVKAETLAVYLTDPSLKMSDSLTLTIGVSPSALALTAPTPATVKTSVCTSAFTLSTLDGLGDVTAALNPITALVNGTGAGGTLYSDSACANAVPQVTITNPDTTTSTYFRFNFATGQSTQLFYFMGLKPAISPELTLTVIDQANILSGASANLTVTAAIAWIGNKADFGWFQAGRSPMGARSGGPSAASGVHVESTGNYLYVSDFNQGRVHKYDYLNGTYIGWIGRFLPAAGLPITGSIVNATLNVQCAATTTQVQTPGWCQGGMATLDGNGALGAHYQPTGLTDDGTYLYVAEYGGHTLTRYELETGKFAGWVGAIGATPTGPGTGLTNTCATTTFTSSSTPTAPFKATPGWCMGGASTGQVHTGNGAITYIRQITYANDFIYAAGFSQVHRWKASTGEYYGWIGYIQGATPTPAAAPDVAGTCTSTTAGRVTPCWTIGGTSYYYSPSSTPGAYNSTNLVGIYADSAEDMLYILSRDQITTNSFGVITKVRMSTGQYQSLFLVGTMHDPQWLASDGPNFYVADTARITRIDRAAGVITGWVGKVSTTPVAPAACATLVTNGTTPGWCLGGLAKSGMEETAFHNLQTIAYDGAGRLIIGQAGVYGAGFPALRRYSVATGAYEGTTGAYAASPTTWSADAAAVGQGQGFDDSSFANATGMYQHGGFLYALDTSNARIKKIDTATGSVVGWIGGITTSPTGGVAGCAGASPMQASPDWCLGSLPNPSYIYSLMIPQNADGILYNPIAITGDGTWLYIVDNAWHRLQRFKISDGSYGGWIGGVGGAAQAGSCTGFAGGQASGSGWCLGGSPTSGSADGYMNSPNSIAYAGGYLYVVDFQNHRVVRWNAVTGAWEGWIGRVNANPTGGCTTNTITISGTPYKFSGTGWCTGGTAQMSLGAATSNIDPGGGFQFWNYRESIVTDGSFLYITNGYNSRIDKYSFAGQYLASIRTTPYQYNNTWTSNPNTVLNTNPATNIPYEAWFPRGLSTDGVHLYGTHSNMPSIAFKLKISTGNVVGWRGGLQAGASPTGGEPGCIGATGVTPGWCQGGTPGYLQGQGYTLGKFFNAVFTAVDADFLYISDESANRITRIPK